MRRYFLLLALAAAVCWAGVVTTKDGRRFPTVEAALRATKFNTTLTLRGVFHGPLVLTAPDRDITLEGASGLDIMPPVIFGTGWRSNARSVTLRNVVVNAQFQAGALLPAAMHKRLLNCTLYDFVQGALACAEGYTCQEEQLAVTESYGKPLTEAEIIETMRRHERDQYESLHSTLESVSMQARYYRSLSEVARTAVAEAARLNDLCGTPSTELDPSLLATQIAEMQLAAKQLQASMALMEEVAH